ncbi:histidinol-phosphate transaminase [Vreelandella olivaria]|uniref:histidinol-phosphate transaminase n=1 Tax=Vreelandella olivaria TaxID=390919 RepID=UPI00201F7BD8|nr:histidinol-phosphate transaminase [Halomonas olivaria]
MLPNDPTPLARREVRELQRYNAGLSSEQVAKRFGVSQIAKLGSNENPYGPSPQVGAAISSAMADSGLYPDAACSLLRDALSARLGVTPEQMVFGNGSEDLIAILCRVFLDHGDKLVTITPAFGLHTLYPHSLGAQVHAVPMLADGGFDIEGLIDALAVPPRMLMFSSPSNPVGSALSASQLEQILSALTPATLLVFDEAYYEYALASPGYPDVLTQLAEQQTPWIVLRTFSKAYALAGLRVGYGVVSSAALADLIDRLRTPFNVNRLAQVAALAALQDEAHLQAGLAATIRERERLNQALTEMGINVVPSLTNFLFFETDQPSAQLHETLLAYGVIVKPWLEPEYTCWTRVSIGSPDENDQFLAALSRSLRPPMIP